MMKKILFILLATLASSSLMAQNNGVAPLAKGEKQLNFGFGFSDYGVPLYASFDFAVHKDVTVTPQLNIGFFNGNNGNDGVLFGLLVKSDYHWNYLIGIPSDWDFYTGLRLGFYFFDGNSDADLGIEVGGRWYWNEKWALNLELAGGTGFGSTLGVSMKL
jgi:hypothetical protein